MEQEYADAMKILVQQYYEHEIPKDAYRAKRKLLVDHMDNEFNGQAIPAGSNQNTAASAVDNPLE